MPASEAYCEDCMMRNVMSLSPWLAHGMYLINVRFLKSSFISSTSFFILSLPTIFSLGSKKQIVHFLNNLIAS